MAITNNSSNSVKTVGIVGTGVIGASWTALFLSRGLKVIASDPVAGAEDRLKAYIENAWPTLQELRPDTLSNSNVPSSLQECLKNLTFVESIDDHLDKVDFVQENTPEKLPIKLDLFEKLDRLAPSHVVLVSSSSGFPSSEYIVNCKRHPERVLVGHPFNPPHLIPGVEVVPHSGTSQESIQIAMDLYRFVDRKPIHVKKECPGFIGNRLQAALTHEAYSLVSRGYVSASDIDTLVADTIALRYALQGVFLTKVLGAGGGMDGFRRHREHLGAATDEWLADMRKHAWKGDREAEDALAASVDEELAVLGEEGVERLPKERDLFILETLKLKQRIAQEARKESGSS